MKRRGLSPCLPEQQGQQLPTTTAAAAAAPAPASAAPTVSSFSLYTTTSSGNQSMLQLLLQQFYQLLFWIKSFMLSLWERFSGPIIEMEVHYDDARDPTFSTTATTTTTTNGTTNGHLFSTNGTTTRSSSSRLLRIHRIRIGRKIAEGGFSFVFRATDLETQQVVALKRIRCDDSDTIRQCKHEAEVHYAVSNHKNCMPLLGMLLQREEQVCYMMFPMYAYSLRAEVNKRIFDRQQQQHRGNENNNNFARMMNNSNNPFFFHINNNNNNNNNNKLQPFSNGGTASNRIRPGDFGGTDSIPPWSEILALQIFRGILDGIDALHRANYSHRDIKLENILFSGSNTLMTPVVMDFGSSGPIVQSLESRRTVLTASDEASTHTTMPYRPPELYPGELRVGDNDLDYRKVDVWSLGCTLFAMLYGASPFESEFDRQTGWIRIVDCSQLRVIGSIPYPSNPSCGPYKWYSAQIKELIQWMLTVDRSQRPTLVQVMARVDSILRQEEEDPLDAMFFNA